MFNPFKRSMGVVLCACVLAVVGCSSQDDEEEVADDTQQKKDKDDEQSDNDKDQQGGFSWLNSPAAAMKAKNSLAMLGRMLAVESEEPGLPSRAIYSEDGKPLLSWRVAMLQSADELELYEQFKLDEPWDSEHNKKLVEKIPEVYRADDSQAPPGYATFLAAAGEKTAFADKFRVKSMPDGATNTILLLEVADEHAVPWTKPADLDIEQTGWQAKLRNRNGKNLALFADYSVRSLPVDTDAETLEALLTRDGKDNDKLKKFYESQNAGY